MQAGRIKTALREIAVILFLSAVLALSFNYFSPRGVGIFRKEAQKISVPDSLLFGRPVQPAGNRAPGDAMQTAGNETTTSSGEQNTEKPDAKNGRAGPVSAAPGKAGAEEQHYSSSNKKANEGPASSGTEKAGELRIITIKQLSQLLSEKRGIIIDARDPGAYKNGRIPGSVNFFGEDPTRHFEALLAIPKDTLIVIYCNNAECDLGHRLLEFMRSIEFTNLCLYDDGWDEWMKRNMPVERSRIK